MNNALNLVMHVTVSSELCNAYDNLSRCATPYSHYDLLAGSGEQMWKILLELQ